MPDINSDDKSQRDPEAAARTRAREFATNVVAPAAQSWEVARRQSRDALQQAANAGLTGLIAPQSAGGQGLRMSTLAGVAQDIAAADLGAAFALVVHNNLMNAIATYGSRAQIDAHFAPLQRLDKLGAFLLTEPGAGSDASNISCHAGRRGGGWVLNGAKAWVTNSANADLLSVYAQTEPGSGAAGIAAFLVPAETPGVTRGAPYLLAGGHSLGTGDFVFEDCEVGDDALLVPPGKGFRAAMAGIDLARALVAAMSCGMLAASLDIAVARAGQRRLFGQRLADLQGMQWQLADVATDLTAAQLLTDHATAALDAGASATVAAAHAKKFATRALESGVAQCMQACGADGLRQSSVLARHLAAARITHYIDGTTEIQNLVIARALFG